MNTQSVISSTRKPNLASDLSPTPVDANTGELLSVVGQGTNGGAILINTAGAFSGIIVPPSESALHD